MSALDKDFTRRLAFLLAETFLRRRRLARGFRGSSMDQYNWDALVKSASADIRNLLRYASDRPHAIACLRAAVIHYRKVREGGMSDAKHTPGPWKAYGLAIYTEAKRAHWLSPRDPKQSLIANVRDNDDGDPENMADNPPFMAEAEANARLIAAAPELLEALETLTSEEWRDDGDPILDAARIKARAAIAKAKGQA